MRTPRHFPDRVVVAGKNSDGSVLRAADVESADQAVDARGGDDAVAVFVPVVGEGFGGGDAGRGRHSGPCEGRGVEGNAEREVVGCRGGGAEVEDAEMRVG